MLFTRRDTLLTGLLLPLAARAQPAAAPPQVLEAKAGTAHLLGDASKETPVFGFDGVPGGPVLRAKQGETLTLRLSNRLDQPTALHWQGLRNVNAMDGAVGLTQAAVVPGATFDITLPLPDAGLSWFRPSCQPFAAEQKARGLYGVLVVEEKEPLAVDSDFVLVIDDWRLGPEGAPPDPFVAAQDIGGEGRIGTLLTVNGKAVPATPTFAPGARLRLRIVNACNARMIGLTFADVRPFVIGVDGQACGAFEPVHKTIPIGPGARFDVIVDLPTQEEANPSVILRGGGLRLGSSEPDQTLVRFKREGSAVSPKAAIAAPPLNPALPAIIRLEAAKRLDLAIEGPGKDPLKPWTMNGAVGRADSKPLFSVKRGQPVSLGFINKTPVAQSIHWHGHVARVLHLLDDGWEPYWRDSAIIAPGKTSRIAFLADNPGKWLIESSILEHAAAGLWGWFEVT